MLQKSTASRREFIQGLALGGVAAALAACTPAPTPTAAAAQPTQGRTAAAAQPTQGRTAVAATPAPKGKVEVSLWQHAHPPLNKTYETLIAEYQQANPNTTVRFDSVAAAEFEQKLLTAMAAETGPDIFRMPTWSTMLYVTKGIVKPLDPQAFGKGSHKELMDEYDPPSSVNGWVMAGKLYAIPIEISVMCTWYRLDVLQSEMGLDKSKLPKTWTELWDLARRLTKKDASGNITRIGFSWTWNAVWGMHHYSPLLWQQGGEILSEDGKTCVLDSPAAIKALDIFAEPYRQGGANKDFSVPQAFENAKLCTYCSGPFAPASVITVNPQLKYGEHFIESRLMQTEGGTPAGYTWGPASLALNPKTKSLNEAYSVMRFIWDRPEAFWEIANIMVTRKKFKETDAYKKSPWLPTFIAEAQIARPAVQSVVYEEIKTAVYQMLQRAVFDGMSSKESVKLAAADITKALAR